MRFYHLSLHGLALLATQSLCADQDILTILKQHTSITAFTSYLELFPDIITVLNGGAFTGMTAYSRESSRD
jgi:hypothetical protein